MADDIDSASASAARTPEQEAGPTARAKCVLPVDVDSPSSHWRALVVRPVVHSSDDTGTFVSGAAGICLLLAEEGRATITIQVGDRRRDHVWVPGKLLLNGSDGPVLISCRGGEPLRGIKVAIPQETVARTAEQLHHRTVDYERMAALVPAADPFLRRMVHALYAAAKSQASELYAESAAAFLVAHLLTCYAVPEPAPLAGNEKARIETVIAVMHERLAEPLTLADLAGEVHLSVYHLVRVFRQATGQTPRRYLTRLRIERAETLLCGGTPALAEVARQCGFTSASALSNAFLRETGVRPSSYRDSTQPVAEMPTPSPSSGTWLPEALI